MALLKNCRSASTIETRATGVLKMRVARRVKRSNGSSAGVSSSPDRCTAASLFKLRTMARRSDMRADYSPNRARPRGTTAPRRPEPWARPAVAGRGRYHGISEPLLHPGDAGPSHGACTPINRPFDRVTPGMRSAFLLRCHRDAGPDARLFTRYFEVFASGTGCTFKSRL